MEKSQFLNKIEETVKEADRFPSKEEVMRRYEACMSCPHRVGKLWGEIRCKQCSSCKGDGQYVKFTTPKRVFDCPLGKWNGQATEADKQEPEKEPDQPLRFRVLNLTPYSGRLFPLPRPDVHYLQIHGRRILFNADTLAAVDCNGIPPTTSPQKMPPALRSVFTAGRPNFPPPPPRRLLYLILEVTHNCNLACEYCFVRHQQHRELPRMSEEVAMKALSMFPPRSDIAVGFFGGEPLLEFKLIQRVVAEAEKRARRWGKRAKFHITTNGLALCPETAAFLRDHNFSIIVSLDGPEEKHNALRKPKNRNLNSYQATRAGLECLHKAGISKRVALRGTYTARDFDIVSRLEHLNALCDAGLGGSVAMEPIMLGETGCTEPTDEMQFTPTIYTRLAAEIHRVSEWFVSRIRAGKRTRYRFAEIYLRRLLHSRPYAAECGAGRGYISVGPEGTLYACHREGASDIGSLSTGFDEAKAAQWQDNRLYCRQGCMKCWARYICGGGCRFNSLNYLGDITKPHPFSCWFTQTQIGEAIWMATQLTTDQLSRIQ